jgi:hypothetical protein
MTLAVFHSKKNTPNQAEEYLICKKFVLQAINRQIANAKAFMGQGAFRSFKCITQINVYTQYRLAKATKDNNTAFPTYSRT